VNEPARPNLPPVGRHNGCRPVVVRRRRRHRPDRLMYGHGSPDRTNPRAGLTTHRPAIRLSRRCAFGRPAFSRLTCCYQWMSHICLA
jgi:hypothetical protein